MKSQIVRAEFAGMQRGGWTEDSCVLGRGGGFGGFRLQLPGGGEPLDRPAAGPHRRSPRDRTY